ncbi:MAG: pyridoxal phosphate-dependent aminotransferase [Sulfitobacter sp.]
MPWQEVKAGFPLRLYQQTNEMRKAKGTLSSSYAELTPMSWLIEKDPSLRERIEGFGGGYSPIFGGEDLRVAIAHHTGVEPDQVIVTNGIDDALPSIYEAILETGDVVSVLGPTYSPIPDRLVRSGATVAMVPFEREDEDLAENTLRALFTNEIAACVLNVPYNPVGWYPDEQSRNSIIDLADATDTWIIADEVYAGLPQQEGTEAPSLASLSDRIISVGSLTKTFGLPGLRIGWIICKDREIIERIKNVRTFGHCYVSALSEMAAIVTLNHAEELIKSKTSISCKNLATLRKVIDKCEFLSASYPEHGTVCMAKLDTKASSFRSASEMCQQLLVERGLILVDNSFFNDNENWVRFGFGMSAFGPMLKEFESFLQNRKA